MPENTTTAPSKKIKWAIFLPPWLIIVAILIVSCVSYTAFETAMSTAQTFIVTNFQWLFNSTTTLAVVLMVVSYFAPISKVRFGGSKCRPMMSYTNYVWIILCTIMAAGILLWACAEPMYHITAPPTNITEGAYSGASIRWAMQTLFLEWTFSPMAIYGLPALLFAFVFFNMKRRFAIGSMLVPTLGDRWATKLTPVVDCICLFCLVCGMAASMGSGVLLLSGGITSLTGIPNGTYLYIICGMAIVVAVIASAASGVMNGIRILSTINSRIYMVMGLFILLCGPTAYILDLTVESFGGFLTNFFQMGLWTSAAEGDGWSRWWPSFYMCCWLAWMPITAVFLGKISKGYTVRETINVIFFIPALFSAVWIGLFSGTAINFELAGYGIYDAMVAGGTEAATYAVLQNLPLSIITIPLFLLIVFVSFVTAADSNTNAMAGLCTEGLTVDDTESPIILKIVWGATLGVLCLVAVCGNGIDGIKELCNVGGFPAAIMFVFFIWGWIKVMMNPAKYDTFQEDYDENGKPIPSQRLPYEGQEEAEAKREAKRAARKARKSA
ncbi:MAG: BCCT family transporter [Clostridiales bacterium]|nr:BCCT family transporter [Clostridiales bacterium]